MEKRFSVSVRRTVTDPETGSVDVSTRTFSTDRFQHNVPGFVRSSVVEWLVDLPYVPTANPDGSSLIDRFEVVSIRKRGLHFYEPDLTEQIESALARAVGMHWVSIQRD